MAAATRFLASATVGGLMVVGLPAVGNAQVGSRSPVPPAARVASFAPGSIHGVVRDERGEVVAGAVVSALGVTTTVAVTGKDGRFEFATLSPGPYLIRSHLAGYVAPRAQMVQVVPGARASSNIALRRVGSMQPVLAAGVGGGEQVDPPVAEPSPDPAPTFDDDHGETAWRLRHARRSVLKDVAIPTAFLTDDSNGDFGRGALTAVELLGRAVGARAATSFFADTPFSGQVNLLTTGSFNTPEQLLSSDVLSRNIAYVHLGAPAGERADWVVRGALTQADLSSWILAGAYTTRLPSRHRYDIGMSYATQRYDGGNLLTLRDVTEGSRNAGTVYGYDSLTLSPSTTLTYGGSYSRYDYLNGSGLISPRVELTVAPVTGLRVSGALARRALAPGAEEFLPPQDAGIWLPPQRTFSSLVPGRLFEAERTSHVEVAVERDFGPSTLAFRAFRQQIDDQLITLFGADVPNQPAANRGHYLVGNVGDGTAAGCSTALRAVVAGRVHGSIEYSYANARLMSGPDIRYWMVVAPSAVRPTPERIHAVATTIETEVPETATRLLVLYRMSNGFAHPADGNDALSRPALDGRFDVQLRQSLPFMNFSNARWEMLLAVRNFFREAGTEQSIYDELLVVRPPKRLIGGVTMRF